MRFDLGLLRCLLDLVKENTSKFCAIVLFKPCAKKFMHRQSESLWINTWPASEPQQRIEVSQVCDDRSYWILAIDDLISEIYWVKEHLQRWSHVTGIANILNAFVCADFLICGGLFHLKSLALLLNRKPSNQFDEVEALLVAFPVFYLEFSVIFRMATVENHACLLEEVNRLWTFIF